MAGADREIPALPNADPLTGAEFLHVVQGGNSRKGTAGSWLLASQLDIDPNLLANSNTKVPSQAAVKSYVDTSDALKAPINSPVFTGVPLAPTAPPDTNTTQIATTAFVQTEISTKLDTSAYTAADVLTKIKTVDGPGSGLDADLLDGLDSTFYLDLANATGTISDAKHGALGGGSLHAIATTSVNGFMAATDKAKLDAIEAGATGDMTAAEILAAIKTVDGAGSGLDADTLDGLSSAAFASVTHIHAQADITNLVSDLAAKAPLASPIFTGNPQAPTPTAGDADTSIATTAFVAAADALKLDASAYTAADVLTKIKTVDGVGSGLDADLLDGNDSSFYATASALALKAPLADPVFTGNPQAPTPTPGDADTSIATTAFVSNAVGAVSAQPGQVAFFPGTAAPTGWLKLNGALLSRTTYAALWTYANGSGNIVADASWAGGNEGAFSTGDGSATFRLPDGRGEFIRGWDDSRGVDSGRAIGTTQADAYLNHTHTADALGTHYHGTFGSTAYSSGISEANVASSGVTTAQATGTQTRYSQSASAGTPSINVSTTGGTETRPRNVPWLACIKY